MAVWVCACARSVLAWSNSDTACVAVGVMLGVVVGASVGVEDDVLVKLLVGEEETVCVGVVDGEAVTVKVSLGTGDGGGGEMIVISDGWVGWKATA